MTEAREQWLLAGQAMLRRGGHTTIKLVPLTAACGLTSGSFYHHFSGIPEYLDALASYYGTEQTVAYVQSAAAHTDPIQRLRAISALSQSEDMAPLDAAMRDWAAVSPVAAESVRAADRILLLFLEEAFTDLGLEEPQVRAHLMVAAGVARITPPWRPVGMDRYIEVLTGQHMSVGRKGKPSA